MDSLLLQRVRIGEDGSRGPLTRVVFVQLVEQRHRVTEVEVIGLFQADECALVVSVGGALLAVWAGQQLARV